MTGVTTHLEIQKPLAMIAELTHRCPLRCVYCSNPLELKAKSEEMHASDWIRVIEQAHEVGVLQLHLTGGEPLLFAQLERLIHTAAGLGMYTNLITSGVGLTVKRMDQLKANGLDHVQLSFQDSEEISANQYSGVNSHAAKLKAAAVIRESGLAFTANFVIHRQNVQRLRAMIDLGVRIGAGKIEVAHAQYHGWAALNKHLLLPTRDQVQESMRLVQVAAKEFEGQIRLEFVVPEVYSKFPKTCMGGWARNIVLVNPRGTALPCHSAEILPGLDFPNVREKDLRWIWFDSPAFNRYRGTEWMLDPCRSCDRREQDLGGCRCQAFRRTGIAERADPVCSLSPDRSKVDHEIVHLQNKTAEDFSSAAVYRG